MEVAMSKSDSMEQEISESKMFRKDLEAQLEDTFAEASQEHKPHESRENLSKQTESEPEVPITSQGGSTSEYQQEISEIKSELEEEVLFYIKECVGHEMFHVLEAKKKKKPHKNQTSKKCKKTRCVIQRAISLSCRKKNKIKREITKVKTRMSQ
eukprot:bmy_17503T0